MVSIGWRNLKRDPVRATVTVCGVVFAVVLVTVEVGMLLGLVRNASLLIDNAHADIWVSTVDVKTFDFATPMSQRKKYCIESVQGVERVEEFNVTYSLWKLPSGGNANCQIIAFNVNGCLPPSLNLVEGSLDALHNQDAVIIDEGDRAKLGNPLLNDYVEILGHRAKVVGFTRGMRSFTTTPYVFTSLRRGDQYGFLTSQDHSRTLYFLVKVQRGYDVDEVLNAIHQNVPEVEAQTQKGFSLRTRLYWLIETGVGLGFLAAAFLGLLVGGVIVSQTLYAMTMEKLPEFGVLKAMGATMPELARIVLDQSLLCGSVGLILGIGISSGVASLVAAAGTTVEIPAILVAAVAVLTLVLCTIAALVSILRLRHVEPAMVFRT